jgi:hypothetical protein
MKTTERKVCRERGCHRTAVEGKDQCPRHWLRLTDDDFRCTCTDGGPECKFCRMSA